MSYYFYIDGEETEVIQFQANLKESMAKIFGTREPELIQHFMMEAYVNLSKTFEEVYIANHNYLILLHPIKVVYIDKLPSVNIPSFSTNPCDTCDRLKKPWLSITHPCAGCQWFNRDQWSTISCTTSTAVTGELKGSHTDLTTVNLKGDNMYANNK